MTRTPVPDQFRSDPEPRASAAAVKYARDLLRSKDLFKSPKWFDAVNAMDHEEYAAYLDRVSEEIATWTPKRVSKLIDALKPLPYKPREEIQGRASGDLPTPEELPTGRYAVEADSGELRFYRLWRGTRNPSYVSLYVQHGPDESKVEWKAVPTILRKIVATGAFASAAKYGVEIGHCGICGTRLTNTLSRELGIGPVCGGRYFADDPAQWKELRREVRDTIVARGEDPDSDAD